MSAVSREVRMVNRRGLHARASAKFVNLASELPAAIEVEKDVTYGGPMTYRAVPAAALLSGLTFPLDSVVEAVAVDGFAAHIPLDLLRNTDASKAIAWVAIEPADHPGPRSRAGTIPPGRFTWCGPRQR